MRIHEIEIENFRCIERRKFSFCEPGTDTPRRLTVLVGPNMSGKTTVLDAIHLAFELVSNVNDPKLRPGFDPSSPSLRPDPSLPMRFTLRFSLQPGEYEAIAGIITALGDPLPPEPAGVLALRLRWPPKEGTSGIASILEEATPRDGNFLLRGRALARVAKSNHLRQEGIFDEVGGVLYLDQHRSVNLAVPSTRTASDEQLRDEARSRDILPWLELQSRLDQKWDPSTQGLSAWSRIKARFQQLAAPSSIDDMKAFDDGFDLRFRQGDRLYYTAGLSFGQAQMLRLVTNLTAFRATRSVVMVDEVELHLHPAWQRRVLHFMRKGGGDDNQFIVTTHSEAISNYLHPDEVLKLGELDEP